MQKQDTVLPATVAGVQLYSGNEQAAGGPYVHTTNYSNYLFTLRTSAMSKKQFWLMKSEPGAYGINDLQRDGVEPWDGVRNYEARNFMRDEMKPGDRAFFYHSNVKPPVITGEMEVCSEPYPDPTQFDPDSKYFDEKSTESDPTWQLVDVKFIRKFENPVTRDELKQLDELSEMMLFKRNRLSITRVREQEYAKVLELAGETFNE